MTHLTRRQLMAGGLLGLTLPRTAFADSPRETWWEDLIPPGVPYSEIIGEGEIDDVNDTWAPVFDANGIKLNDALDGVYIKMPGYIVPMVYDGEGVTEFILVPYLGACIHVPPPPPNQLVYVTAETPWQGGDYIDAVWVTGRMRTQLQTTELAEIGYALTADHLELYEW